MTNEENDYQTVGGILSRKREIVSEEVQLVNYLQFMPQSQEVFIQNRIIALEAARSVWKNVHRDLSDTICHNTGMTLMKDIEPVQEYIRDDVDGHIAVLEWRIASLRELLPKRRIVVSKNDMFSPADRIYSVAEQEELLKERKNDSSDV